MEKDFNEVMPLKDMLVIYERLFNKNSLWHKCEADSDYHKDLSLFEQGTIIDYPEVKVLIIGFDNEDRNGNIICLTANRLTYPNMTDLSSCRNWFTAADARAKHDFLVAHFGGEIRLTFLSRGQFIPLTRELQLSDCVRLLEKELL